MFKSDIYNQLCRIPQLFYLLDSVTGREKSFPPLKNVLAIMLHSAI